MLKIIVKKRLNKMDINKKYKKNDFCRYCYSKNLLKYLSLGKHPPSNSFIKIEDISNEDSFPLEVYANFEFCHAQTANCVATFSFVKVKEDG